MTISCSQLPQDFNAFLSSMHKLVRSDPVAAGSKRDLSLAKAEPMSDGSFASVKAYLKES